VSAVNSKRHNTQISIANAKHAIVRDMDEFSRELANTKDSLSATQAAMFGTIKEKLQQTYDVASLKLKNASSRQARDGEDENDGFGLDRRSASRDQMMTYTTQLLELVNNSGFQAVEELINDLEQSEDQIFTYYNEIQEKNVELETLEHDNKQLEFRLSDQMSKLDALEKYNSKVRLELEQHISHIQLQIAKYDAEYAKSLEVINSISDSLIILLKNVSSRFLWDFCIDGDRVNR
jgi:predicted RNase H-like nuclease (RuvC/YqgF family)